MLHEKVGFEKTVQQMIKRFHENFVLFFQIRMAMTKGAVAIVLDITEYHAAVRLVSYLI